MGKRDRQGREVKKAKKQPAKVVVHPGTELTIVPPVQVVKRKRKHEDDEESE